MIDILYKKRNGDTLSKEEIAYFVKGYNDGTIPDYQMSALLMAIYFQKMTSEETIHLTNEIIATGDIIDLSMIEGIKVDKHSTGGVGDKTTIALGPLVAANGVPTAKLSGRGLGHTGGTIDKLESIPGFHVDLEVNQFVDQVNQLKFALGGQTHELAPADKKFYALRDVTATIDNVSLIASSVMSKKIASGADGIVLDVKAGSGAFMKSIDEAFQLGKSMVDIGSGLGKETVAIITDMEQPLGNTVGNGIEVREAVDILQGKGPDDLLTLCKYLGGYMLFVGKKVLSLEEGINRIQRVIDNGTAYKRFIEVVEAQGGDSSIFNNPEDLYQTEHIYELKSSKAGYIHRLSGEKVGKAALYLGAGRLNKDTSIDHSVGIELIKKIGDYVAKNETIAKIYYNNPEKFPAGRDTLEKAYEIHDESVESRPIIYGIVTKDRIERFSS